MTKIFSEEEITIFKKSLSILPPFKQILTTDKHYFSVKLDEDIKTQAMVDQFKQVVVEFLKSVEDVLP